MSDFERKNTLTLYAPCQEQSQLVLRGRMCEENSQRLKLSPKLARAGYLTVFHRRNSSVGDGHHLRQATYSTVK